ncbi:MAG: EscU/YscU/HrcU family type III secretion system export apparatus switch protein [Bdellovibrionota bacterium]
MESREEKNSEDKTEEATDERRNQFREEGNIANPREVVAAAVLLFFTLYFYLNASNMMKGFSLTFERAWSGFRPQEVGEKNLIQILYYTIQPTLHHIFVIFFTCIIFPLLIGLLFTRFNFSVKKISFNLNKINPTPGFARIFGTNSITEIVKIVIKILVFSSIIYCVLKKKAINSNGLYFLNYFDYLKEVGASVFLLLFSMSIAVIILGIGDFAFNLWKIEKELKMSKQDLKEDLKKHEGDPQIKSKRKRMARDLIFRKSLKDVPKATFIVTNPEHFAVAIRYLKGMNAPIVVAKGQDLMALKIREIAKKHEIIIVENKPLARTLYKTVKIGQEIPPSLYQAIIEIMRYIYKIKGQNYFDKFTNYNATI